MAAPLLAICHKQFRIEQYAEAAVYSFMRIIEEIVSGYVNNL